ncbi:hypothetical protein [Aegicerativicinus sediminis]|uniref:hypothetical protein n=1 Tax=Aegicerativicinus sediminis TaxID=2893202 RepID=UPI001E375083|nr:hypothetical protein [Aegicerativicinus sediminis]
MNLCSKYELEDISSIIVMGHYYLRDRANDLMNYGLKSKPCIEDLIEDIIQKLALVNDSTRNEILLILELENDYFLDNGVLGSLQTLRGFCNVWVSDS